MSEWTSNNKEYYIQKRKEWGVKNPERLAEHKHNDYIKHKAARLATDRTYVQNNREKINARYNTWQRGREATDVAYRLARRLRTRLFVAMKNNQKKGSAVSDLGCSVQHLKLHLELFWDEGMSWLNYGNKPGQWSIDHIKPLASFDLTDRSQLLQAVHYTNLQPLWHVDNMTKSDNYTCG